MRKLILVIAISLCCSLSYAGIACLTDDYIDSNDVAWCANYDVHSVSMWIKTTQTTRDAVYGSFNDGNTLGFQFWINTGDAASDNQGYLWMSLRDDVGDDYVLSVQSDTGITDGGWHHILISADFANNDVEIYIDSVSKTISTDLDEDPTVYVNCDYEWTICARNLRGTISTFSNIDITDFAIWTSELGQAEATLLSDSKGKRMPLQIDSANLFIYLPLDDEPDASSADGDDLIDLSFVAGDAVGNNGGNNTGMTALAETVLTYP